MIHFTLSECTQVGLLPELKCPTLRERPVCASRCSRKVQNTTKHPTGVYHINIIQVNLFLCHSGALGGKHRGKFWPKTAFLAPVVFSWFSLKTQKLPQIFSYLLISSIFKYIFLQGFTIQDSWTWNCVKYKHQNYSSKKGLSTKDSICVLMVTFDFLLFTSRFMSTIVGLLLLYCMMMMMTINSERGLECAAVGGRLRQQGVDASLVQKGMSFMTPILMHCDIIT